MNLIQLFNVLFRLILKLKYHPLELALIFIYLLLLQTLLCGELFYLSLLFFYSLSPFFQLILQLFSLPSLLHHHLLSLTLYLFHPLAYCLIRLLQ